MTRNCVIALDLGTTAFKSAPVDATGLLADPTVVSYNLDYHDGAVTFDPESYLHLATAALAGAIRSARAAGLLVTAIGISSQAQTYIPLDGHGKPMQQAIVWTDGRAVEEAREAAQVIPDFAAHSGFRLTLPEMFMPKVRQFVRSAQSRASEVWKYALLNEYIIYRLTGAVYGDTTNQGMSGFYHITERRWSQAALAFAGIEAGQLADTAGAAQISQLLALDWCHALGINAAPVYSCGNDQSCSAAGVGLTAADDILCNFGTAMVIYALKDSLPRALMPRQIAGINRDVCGGRPVAQRCLAGTPHPRVRAHISARCERSGRTWWYREDNRTEDNCKWNIALSI
jgi:gluconokinase